MYQSKHVVILGAARSGLAAARFLAARGAHVTLSDQKKGDALKEARAALADVNVSWEEGENRPETCRAADFVLVSPGVPRNIPALRAAQEAGREIIGEVELAFRHLKAPLIAITGSNGKSTTTVLVGEILKQSGKNVFVGGNLGTPLIEAAEKDFDIVVAEISSFQLEWTRTFRPHIAAILNVSPNHLDRHASFEEYVAEKLKIFAQQGKEDYSVFGADDPVLSREVPAHTRARPLSFSLSQRGAAAHLEGEDLVLSWEGKREAYPLSQLRLRGRHNWENALCALLLSRLAGATEEGAQKALSSFAGLPHRLETIRTLGGVTYINDSKATSVAAAQRALEAFPPETPVILLAGGKDKGGSYAPLVPLVRERCRAVILFGEARPLLSAALKGASQVEEVEDLGEAVRRAHALARPGDVVLLAPACSSYDQFPHFEARGNAFRAYVEAL